MAKYDFTFNGTLFWSTFFAHYQVFAAIDGCCQISDIATYRKISNIRRTLVGNNIVDHSDVVGASPVGAAPTTSSFSTWQLGLKDSAKTAARQYDNLLSVGILFVLY